MNMENPETGLEQVLEDNPIEKPRDVKKAKLGSVRPLVTIASAVSLDIASTLTGAATFGGSETNLLARDLMDNIGAAEGLIGYAAVELAIAGVLLKLTERTRKTGIAVRAGIYTQAAARLAVSAHNFIQAGHKGNYDSLSFLEKLYIDVYTSVSDPLYDVFNDVVSIAYKLF